MPRARVQSSGTKERIQTAGSSLNDAVCCPLIFIQQQSEGRSLPQAFLPGAAAPTIPLLAPRCVWQLLYVSVCVCE